MICNANLEGQGSIFSSFRGNDTDFNRNWFTSQGDTIVASMVFNTWFPIAMECANYSQRLSFRMLDWFSKDSDKKTAKTNIQQYINLYSGPKYLLHYRYSTMLNVVFITMMFGAGMPILFPIAAVSLTCFLNLEKFMLYYVFQQPPAYDERLNNAVLHILDKGPVFLLAFGYWLLTNLQLVENNYLEPKEAKSDPFFSQHIWMKYWNPMEAFNSGPAGALLIMLYVYILYLIFRSPVTACYEKCFPQDTIQDLFTDEEIECKDCGDMFLFSAREQAFYEKKGYSAMVRCKSCIQSKKERMALFDKKGITSIDKMHY